MFIFPLLSCPFFYLLFFLFLQHTLIFCVSILTTIVIFLYNTIFCFTTYMFIFPLLSCPFFYLLFFIFLQHLICTNIFSDCIHYLHFDLLCLHSHHYCYFPLQYYFLFYHIHVHFFSFELPFFDLLFFLFLQHLICVNFFCCLVVFSHMYFCIPFFFSH